MSAGPAVFQLNVFQHDVFQVGPLPGGGNSKRKLKRKRNKLATIPKDDAPAQIKPPVKRILRIRPRPEAPTLPPSLAAMASTMPPPQEPGQADLAPLPGEDQDIRDIHAILSLFLEHLPA